MEEETVRFSEVVTFCAPRELVERVKEHAAKAGQRPSEWLRGAVRERLRSAEDEAA